MSGGAAKTVCVTGASGYIASWIVKFLLQRGYTVKASVRDPGLSHFSSFYFKSFASQMNASENSQPHLRMLCWVVILLHITYFLAACLSIGLVFVP